MNQTSRWDKWLIFFVSFFCICLELFLTRLLNLKTYNHVVYVIIPFAILGYGVGANLFLLSARIWEKVASRYVIGWGFILLSVLSVFSVFKLAYLPLSIKLLEDFFLNAQPGLTLSFAYLILMLPFVVIGFLILFFFSKNPEESGKLYFWDLVGAGLGAVAFFFLIYQTQLIHSVLILSVVSFGLGLMTIVPRFKMVTCLLVVVAIFFSLHGVNEIGFAPSSSLESFYRRLPSGLVQKLKSWQQLPDYESDAKGWENFPKFFKPDQYETLHRKWHPLGRTDIYRILGFQRQTLLYYQAEGTFEINLNPRPEFAYFSTNFLGGTPVYNYAPEGLAKRNSKLELFSQAMEFPYVLLNSPKVVVIGAGGGRDIFMAKTHGAMEVVAAEINPEVYRQMAPGGGMYQYSGGVYTLPGVRVENIDGRNFVKNLKKESYDLVVLNGVDTFSGLSSGAYAYAESYLYTVNAVKDYLTVLKPEGMINFNRWIFVDQPRETLKLMVIIMEALKSIGVQNPWEHIMIGAHHGWGMTLVKKTPFTLEESMKVAAYFQQHKTDLVYPSESMRRQNSTNLNFFDMCALAFIHGKQKEFIDGYRFDISAVTDDNPFFYKYYRFRDFNPKDLKKASLTYSNYGAGFVIFLTQGLVLINAIVFSLIFIGLPLFFIRRQQIQSLTIFKRWAFILYYACLGIGFMFVEIPLMQKFTLFLGSPIYSISVSLAVILISSGVGSFFLNFWQKRFASSSQLIWIATAILTVWVLFLMMSHSWIVDYCIGWPFALRTVIVCLLLLPVGLTLGIFFPSGMKLITSETNGLMAWAWGINCGFSVVGSMTSIILAQFYGFNLILSLSILTYWIAALAFQSLSRQ